MVNNRTFMKTHLKEYTLLFLFICLFVGCQTEGGIGEFYQLTYKDSIEVVTPLDTLTIMLNQLYTGPEVKEIVPFEINVDTNLVDKIKLEMLVKYGDYTKTHIHYEFDTLRNDSLFIWYARMPRPISFPKRFTNSNSNNFKKMFTDIIIICMFKSSLILQLHFLLLFFFIF